MTSSVSAATRRACRFGPRSQTSASAARSRPGNASAARRLRPGRLKDTRPLRTDREGDRTRTAGPRTPRETRSCLSAQVSLLAWRSAPRSPCRGISPPRPGAASGIFGTKSGPRQLHDRLGFLAVPRLWGLPDSPQAQAVGFPTHTRRYSESPYGSSPARFPASICSAAWDRLRT